MTQYLACKFYPASTQTYTYQNDGDPVAIGDKVDVEAKGEHIKSVEVVEIVDAPDFNCKAILGLSPPREDADADPDNAAETF